MNVSGRINRRAVPVIAASVGGLVLLCGCCAAALAYFNSIGAPMANATRTQAVQLSATASATPVPLTATAAATTTIPPTATAQATQSNRISAPVALPSSTPTAATFAIPTNTTQAPIATNTARSLPTNTQAPIATAEPPTAEPTTAAPAPTQASAFTIITLTSPVPVNGDATVTIQTEPGASCSLRYVTPAGNESQASGLGAQTADGGGVCSWTWHIGGSTHPGTGTLTVTANGVTQRFEIVIQ